VETDRHAVLKRLAAMFLHAQGCRAIGAEVRCPASRYRADVAGYLDRLNPRRRPAAPPDPAAPAPAAGPLVRGERPKTAIIECKQTRADFLRDTAETDRLLRERASLEARRLEFEEHRIKPAEPQLRRSGSYLFGDLEEWDFTATRLPTYRRLLASLRAVDAQLYGQTKFFLMSRYRLADYLFIMAPAGMIRRRELPVGWGLLECPPRWLARAAAGAPWAADGAEPVQIRVAAPPAERPSKPEFQSARASPSSRAACCATSPPPPRAPGSPPPRPLPSPRRRRPLGPRVCDDPPPRSMPPACSSDPAEP
jgi:hypothetical protein